MKINPNATFTQRKIYQFKGILFCFLVLFSSCYGFLFVFPVALFLNIFGHNYSMKLMNLIQLTWNAYVTQLLQTIFNINYHMHGCEIEMDKCIVITNHTTRLDWLLMLPLILENDRLHHLRFSLKAPLMKVPGVGWSLQYLKHLFLNRNFEKDKNHIKNLFTFYQNSLSELFFVLYPEGTVMWPDTQLKSKNYAKAKNLPGAEYKHLLSPRTTGFEFILEQCRRTGIETIYDITSLYTGPIPQDERAFFCNG